MPTVWLSFQLHLFGQVRSPRPAGVLPWQSSTRNSRRWKNWGGTTAVCLARGLVGTCSNMAVGWSSDAWLCFVCSTSLRIVYLAVGWAALRGTPRASRRLACILSDYPGKAGRGGYAVGLDTGASVAAIGDILRGAGFDVGPLPPAHDLMRVLTESAPQPYLGLAEYRHRLAALPVSFAASVTAAWGDPADDPDCRRRCFSASDLPGRKAVARHPARSGRNRSIAAPNTTTPPCPRATPTWPFISGCGRSSAATL